MESISECEKIRYNDDDDTLIMFDKPEKVNMHKQTESISQVENITSNENSSQIIIDDTSNSEITTLSLQSEENVKETSSSQIIETETEDLSQFVGDVSSIT